MNQKYPEVKSGQLDSDTLTNLGNTLVASEKLSSPLKEAIAMNAKSVFIDSMHIAAFFAALLLVCTSVLTDRILKPGRPIE
jgi:hypothetical protein